MARRRRTPPAGTPQGERKPDPAGPITSASPPPDALASAEPALAEPHPPGSVHDALLESVSPEALQSHDEDASDAVPGTKEEQELEPVTEPEPALQAAQDDAPPDGSAAEPRPTESAPDPIPENVSTEAHQDHGDTTHDAALEAIAEPEPEPVTEPEPALQAAQDDAPGKASPEEPHHPESAPDVLSGAISATVTDDGSRGPLVEAVTDITPEPVPVTDPEPVLRAAQDIAAAVAPAPVPIGGPALTAAAPTFPGTSALDALSELTESNATLVAFLRNEGSATLAHWRSLAMARSAADVVRLQMDEMQRAADASLTCVSTLARRAGRFASLLGRP